MAELLLKLMGDIHVFRDGESLALPPSRKTRGLLAYLALTQRSTRREQLCELLWEVPDDPRGSLRWSLSKLRKLVNCDDKTRLIADRNTVAFDTSDVVIDTLQLHGLANGGAAELDTQQLQQVVDDYQDAFLEGLELPNFHDFYTWCMGERERVFRSQASLLEVLISRLEEDPQQALVYAQRLVSLQPYDEQPRANVIGLLLRSGRKGEAQEQQRMGLEKFAEAGIESSGLLHRALRQAPSPATAADPAASRRSAAKLAAPGLVGRKKELSLLAGLIDDLAVHSRAQVVLIRGEPGLGKSRLLQVTAAAAREAGAGVLKANAFESDMIRPFGVWNDALRRALGDNPTSDLMNSGDTVSQVAVFDSLTEALRGGTAAGPLVVMCDDVQWCDASSISALNHVVRMNLREPLLVVGTSRVAELRENPAVRQVLRSLQHDHLLQEIRLEPLSVDDTCELINLNVPDVDAEALSKECGGNPLMAMELARAAVEGSSGGSLADLVRDRLSRLDEQAETLLHWASVLSPRVSVETLEQVTGVAREVIERALESAVDQGMLLPGDRGLRFSHDLVARSVYGEIPSARRQSMHRRVAQQLEIDAGVDLSLAADLSHHASRSGDPALAVRAMVSAGKLCLRFYANDDALSLYHKGLEFAQQLPSDEQVKATLELCEIRLNAAPQDDWEAEIDEFVNLAEQAIDYNALSHARMGYQMASYVRWMHDQWREAQRFSLQAERVARGATDEAQIWGLGEAAKCLAMLEKDLSQADAMAMEASALAQRSQLQCPAIHTAMGILHYYGDRMDDAVEQLERARTLSKTAGERLNEYLANEYLALLEIERGDFFAAQLYCKALVEIGSKVREGSERPFSLVMQSIAEYGEGQIPQDIELALTELQSADAKQRLAVALNRLAVLDLERGEWTVARARATQALAFAQTMERPSEALYAHVSLQRLHLEDGEGDAQLEDIGRLHDGPIAPWVKRRAAPLLH